MRTITVALLALSLAGCTSAKGAFKSNEANIAMFAPLATGPGCAAAAQSLQPGENQIVCTSLQSCDAAFCAAAKTTPTPAGILPAK